MLQLLKLTAQLFTHSVEDTMPVGWNAKDRRQFRHILKSALSDGRSRAEAEELAARTVNKSRRLQGRTPNKRSLGTGNPHRPLTERTYRELCNRARELDISGRSKLRKDALIRRIREAS